MKALLRYSLVIVLCCFSCSSAIGQVSTGTPPLGSFTGGPDVTNLGNLNFHYGVPVFSKAGRGMPFTYIFGFDSSVWTPVGVSGAGSWQPDGYWGWHPQTASVTGYVSYSSRGGHCNLGTRQDPYVVFYNLYNFGAYVDEFGGFHNINAPTLVDDTQCPAVSGYPTSASVQATDGSGYSFLVDAGPSATVYPRAGGSITPPLNTPANAGKLTDANGNTISFSGSSFIDTLGMTALTISGTPPNPVNLTYTDSSGTARSVTIAYSTFTVQSNFGCPGISEYGPTSVSLVSSISLPNNTSVSFSYEATPGYPGNITGRLASITLPTSGQISYAYTGGNHGIVCADGSTAGLTRSDNDGTTTYARTGSGTSWTTTVTDAQGNQEVINFQSTTPTSGTVANFYETRRIVKQGGTTVLVTTDTCYNGAVPAPDCTNTAVTLPITEVKKYLTLPNGQQSLTDTLLNSFGLVTETDEYDFGNPVPATPLRKTSISFAPLGNNIVDRPSTVLVQDGAGARQAATVFYYDESTVTATSGVPQHGAVTGSRGNVTTLVRLASNPNSNITSTFTYDDTGNEITATDPRGNQAQFSYVDNFSDGVNRSTLAYRTQVTLPDTNGVHHVMKAQFDANTGQTVKYWDQNNNQTTFAYDLLGRPLQTNFPDQGAGSLSYNDTWPNLFVGRSKLQTAGNWVSQDTSWRDPLGRYVGRIDIDPQGYDYGNVYYDTVGNVTKVDDRYRSPAATPTHGSTQMQYDALGRTTQVTRQDGSIISTDYSQFPIVTFTDEAGKTRKAKTDGLSRVVTVWEDPSGLNYETDYQYDTLGNVLRVDQKGSAPSDSTKWRTRTFAYDALSRLLCSANPEVGGTAACPNPDNGAYTPGTIRYSYDGNGNVLTRVAPAPNQTGTGTVTTTYGYDALNRLTSQTYSDSTPARYFAYDGTGWWGVMQTNTVGRLQEAWVGTPCCVANGGAAIFGYDPMGRLVMNNQCLPDDCPSGGVPVSYTYDLMGDLTTYTTGVGVTFTQSFDSLGRTTQLTSSMSDAQHPGTLATVDPNIGYYATGIVRKVTLGSGLTETAAFNIRLQPCRTNVNISGTALLNCPDAIPAGNVQDFSYGFSPGTSDNSNLASFSASGVQSFSRSYAYDSLNRLQSMSAPGDACSGLSWTYDAWANRTDQTVTGGTCNPFHQLVDANNHLSGSGYQYDAAGNLTNDGNHIYTYDAEGRVTQVDGGNTASYQFDAFGRRVRKAVGSTWIDYVYDLSGNVVTEFVSPVGACAPVCWATSYVYLGGALIAEYKNGTTYFVHKDHLGSVRLLTAAGTSTRIQSTGGTSLTKYYYDLGMSVNGTVYTVSAWIKNQGTAQVQINSNLGTGVTVAPGATQFVSFNTTGNAVSDIQFLFNTLHAGDPIDVLAYTPWVSSGGGNLIPSANQNFSGWNTYQGSSVTITQGQAPMIVDSMDYLPYGEQIAGGSATTHKFTGDERDSESGLDHTWFRQYANCQGRWVTPDPLLNSMNPADPQSLNRYAYVNNNPLNAFDPLGLEPAKPCYIAVFGWNDHRKNGVGQYNNLVPDEAAAYPYDSSHGLLGNLVNTDGQSIFGHANGGTRETATLIKKYKDYPGGIVVLGYSGGVQDISTAVQNGLVTQQALNNIVASINISPGIGLGGAVLHLGDTSNFRGSDWKDWLATFHARGQGLVMTMTTQVLTNGKEVNCGHKFECEFKSPQVREKLDGLKPCSAGNTAGNGGLIGDDGSFSFGFWTPDWYWDCTQSEGDCGSMAGWGWSGGTYTVHRPKGGVL